MQSNFCAKIKNKVFKVFFWNKNNCASAVVASFVIQRKITMQDHNIITLTNHSSFIILFEIRQSSFHLCETKLFFVDIRINLFSVLHNLLFISRIIKPTAPNPISGHYHLWWGPDQDEGKLESIIGNGKFARLCGLFCVPVLNNLWILNPNFFWSWLIKC